LAKNIKKKEEDIKAYRHEKDARKNVILVGLASYDISKPKPKKYEYDPHHDPQLIRNRTASLILNLNSSPAPTPCLSNSAKKTASPSRSLTIEGMRLWW
jgi:hypothetical protein